MHKLLLATLLLGLALGWLIGINNPTLLIEHPTGYASKEQTSPGDYINEEQLLLTNDRLIINQPTLILTRYTNTNSMDPLLDETSNGIELPYDGRTLQPGDIISYKDKNIIKIHRVLNNTTEGYLVKGDNSNISETINKKDIKGILVGVLY
ncbi:MAG: S26 family signal peptidase [Nanoarchaeota archaeon]|nr:S26 family signal peptidase [Nanoarchaeota archaeon]